MSQEYTLKEVEKAARDLRNKQTGEYSSTDNAMEEGADILEAFAATLRQQAARVDEGSRKHATNIALLKAGYYVSLPERHEAYDAALAALSAQPAEPVLDADARIGHMVFRKGVRWSTVIGAAQRQFKYHEAQPAERQGEAVAYFAADPAEGEFNTYKTLSDALAGAESMLESAQDEASDYGWQDEPPQICYGVVLGKCVELEGSRRPAPEGSEFTALVDYRLTAPTHPAAPVGVPDGMTAGQRAVAAELLRCCESWEPGVRVMGNVQAKDAADLMRFVLAALSTSQGVE